MTAPGAVPGEDAHLGEGWKFPPRWTRQGAVESVRGEVDVREAIRIILGTELRSRVMRPRFGADVFPFVFAERRAETCFRLQAEVERALLLWEPRIIVQKVEASPNPEDDGRIDVLVEYLVDRHRRPESLVYPFYLEGRSPTRQEVGS